MASQLLCDLDTQQTVYVSADGRYGGRPGLDAPYGSRAAQNWSQPPSGSLASPRQPLSADWRGQGLTADSDTDAASLLWLLDYRLDHLLSPGGASCGQQTQQYHHQHHQQCQQQYQQEQQQQQQQDVFAPHTRWDAATLQTVPQEPSNTSHDRKPDGNCTQNASKPPFTYTELIEQALLEEGQMTVSDIYRWITKHFTFYKSCDDRWKNSVRHNLSMNPNFRKGCKAGSGAGHLWTLAEAEGRRARRCHTAARMGRPPPPQQPAGGDSATSADTTVPGPVTLKLCEDITSATLKLREDIPSPSQEIWPCSSSPKDKGRPVTPGPVTPGPAPDPCYIVQYCTYPPEVAATVELPQEESVDCELNNNNGNNYSDSRVEAQLLTSLRNDNQLASPGHLTGDHQLTTGLYS